MASTIKVKRSAVSGNAPTTSNLSTGELALNTADGILYSANGTNVFEVGANLTSLSVTGDVTLGGGISIDANTGLENQVITSDGAGGLRWANQSGGAGLSARDDFVYTATSGQTVFTGADDNNETLALTSDYTEIYLNGVFITSQNYTANSTHVTFNSGVNLNDIVLIRNLNVVAFTGIDDQSATANTTITITAAGDVGIGDQTPSYKLDVNGSGHFTSLYTSGHILPTANVTYDLGSDTMRFRDIYLSGTTINLGTLSLTDNSGTFAVLDSGDSQVAVSLSANDTDDLTEGSSNLYYTNERVDDRVAALLTAGTNVSLSYDDVNGTLTVSANDTSVNWSEIQNKPDPVITLGGDLSGSVTLTDLASGTLTATIVANAVALGNDTSGNYVESLVAGTGVTLSNNSGEGATPTVAIGQAVETTSDVTFNTVTADLTGDVTGNVTGTVSSLSNHDTDDLTEGASNLYYTTARWDSKMAAADTDDLTEGASNLYYTDARARAAISASGDLSYNSTTGVVSYTEPSPVITLAGDLSGSATLTSLGNATLTATIVANSVALGTDTTGNYVASLVAGTGVTLSNNSGESATPTIAIGQSVGTSDNVTFNDVTVSGTLTSDDITSTNISVAGNATITGNLTVSGTTTTVNSNTVAIGDSIITLNSDETGTPSQNGGIEIERGTSTNVSWVWDETNDRWTSGSDAIYTTGAISGASLTTTGNITVGGTVDGRDVATDGSKLDGIESGATADQTASEILTLIKTVDGASSGLDADTVDGIQASSFLRSDANDTATGTLSLNGRVNIGDSLTRPDALNSDSVAHLKVGASDVHLYVASLNSNGGYKVAIQAARDTDFASFTLNLQPNGGALQRAGYTIWDSGNDGSGSGLDADTVDGIQGASFLRSDAADIMSATPAGTTSLLTLNSGNNFPLSIGTTSATGNPSLRYTQNGTEVASISFSDSDDSLNLSSSAAGANVLKVGTGATGLQYKNATVFNTVWHAGNDGSGSGLDADTVDGIQGASFLRSDASDAVSAGVTYTWAATNTQGLVFENSDYTGHYLYIGGWDAGTNSNYISRIRNSTGNLHIDSAANGGLYLNHYSSGILHLGNGGGYALSYTSMRSPIFYDSNNTAYYVDPASTSNLNALNVGGSAVLTTANEGSGNGIDADTVDGIQGASFLRSDAADTATGQIFFDAGFDAHPIMLSGAQNFDNIDRSGFYNLYNTQSGSTNSPPLVYGTMIAVGNDKGSQGFGLQIAHERTGAGFYVRGMNDSGSTWYDWDEIWTSGTDGSGSGLDADLLDGVQGSSFLRSDANDIITGDDRSLSFGTPGAGSTTGARFLSIEGNSDTSGEGSGRIFFSEHNSTTASMDNYGFSIGYRGGDTSIVGASGNTWTGLSAINNGEWGMWGHDGSAAGSLIAHGPRSGSYADFTNLLISGNQVWHAGNDGSGSGLDADLLDGVQGASYLRSDAADTATGALTLSGAVTLNNHLTWNAGKNIYVDGESSFDVRSGGTWSVWDGANSTIMIKAAYGSQVQIGQSANRGLYVYGSGTASADWRAPIFYDSDDTARYIDPANGGFNIKFGTNNAVHAYTNNSGIHINNAEGVSSTLRLGAAWGRYGVYNDAVLQLMSDSTNGIYFVIDNTQYGTLNTDYFYHTSDIRSPIFYDSDNTGYYVNPNGASSFGSWNTVSTSTFFDGTTAKLNIENQSTFARFAFNKLDFWEWSGPGNPLLTLDGGYGQFSNSARAPIFYDSDNTGYYGDFASSSVLNTLYVNGGTAGLLIVGETSSNGDTFDAERPTLQLRGGQYPHLTLDSRLTSGGATTGNTTHGGTISIVSALTSGYRRWSMGTANYNPDYLNFGYWDNNANPHYGNGNTSYGVKMWIDTGGSLHSTGSMRSPIFYDSNDTGYYVDPNTTGISINTAGKIRGSYFVASHGSGYTQYKGYDNNNHFILVRGSVGGNTTTPTLTGAHHTTFVEYAEANDSTGWFFKTSQTGNYDVVSRITRSYSYFQGSARAPVFYDSDDTGYYSDHNSTAANCAKFKGGIHVSVGNTTNQGIILADDGDIVDPNNGYAAHRFSNGITVNAGNRTGGAVVYLKQNGEIWATNNITAYYSDERLKDKVGNIDNALDKIKSLSGFTYYNNQIAKDNGFKNDKLQHGLSAQEVQKIAPELVDLAPFDTEEIHDENKKVIGKKSKSGEDYLTLDYSKLVPLLVEAMKEQNELIEKLTKRIEELETK